MYKFFLCVCVWHRNKRSRNKTCFLTALPYFLHVRQVGKKLTPLSDFHSSKSQIIIISFYTGTACIDN